MSFIQKLNEYVLSVEQDGQQPIINQGDEAQLKQKTPAPDAAPETPEKQEIAPEGYVEMVRLLAKALVMNVPPDAIDDLFTGKIAAENASAVREGLENLINTSSNYKDNPEKLENKHFLEFYESINENNFYKKFNEIVNIMKKYSHNIDVQTK
jgi:hypothetical protein